jgi:dipeptidyl-peptidase-4
MKRALLILFMVSCFSSSVFSHKKTLSIEDVMTNPAVYPENLRNLQWLKDVDKLSSIKDTTLIFYTPNSKQKEKSLELSDLNKALQEIEVDKLPYFPSIEWKTAAVFVFQSKNSLYAFNVQTKKAEKLISFPEKAENVERSTKSNYLAYTKENNLYVLIDGDKKAVTNESDPNIVSGQTVSRVEFGIEKGSFWSPQENYLAFYQKDESLVTDYPLIDIDTRVAILENIKYPMAGMQSEYVYLGVYDVNTEKTLFLETGENIEQYLTSITWSPDEKYIYLALLNRGQNHMKLNKYDVKTGKLVTTLFEEKNEKYVEPEHPLYFPNKDASQFIYFSERDGFQHMYLYSAEGKLLKQLTKGEWVVSEFLGFSADNSEAYFMATKESPLENNAYSVNLKSGKIIALTPEKGVHNVSISPSGKYIIDTYSNTTVARQINVLNRKGEIVKTLLENKNPLKEYATAEVELITLVAEDGTPLYARIIKPQIEEGEKYPVIVYVYGGPHAQLVTNSWLGGANLFHMYLAQQGFVVFTLDNRGSANRGFEFESAIHKNLGDLEVKDQMQGIQYLESLDFVDMDRIGVDGWSYGGFMTISLMLKHPEVFKVGCAGGPVIDWKWYEVMYGERYMSTPQENEEGYEKANLLNYVEKLEGKLLIFHGTEDPTVVWQQSLAFIKEAVNEGKLLDYFVYPGHGHNVRGKDRIHLYKKIEQYFMDNL